jgi:hypothetical protein
MRVPSPWNFASDWDYYDACERAAAAHSLGDDEPPPEEPDEALEWGGVDGYADSPY